MPSPPPPHRSLHTLTLPLPLSHPCFVSRQWGPPMGLLLENLTLDDAAAAAAAFEAEVVLQGPFNHDPAYVKTVALDFGGRPGAIRLGAGGQLFVDKLVGGVGGGGGRRE